MSEIRAGREEELLRIATRLFKEKGYHNTSMQDLADAFGVQKASLYYYIDSKEELLRRLMERAIAILGTHIDEIYATDLPGPGASRRDPDGPPESGVRLPLRISQSA